LVGTAEYVSPEALNSDFSKDNYSKDLWALGCIMYRFFEGTTPFREKNEMLIFDKILNFEEVNFSKKTPSVAQDLIIKLLEKKVENRIGMKDFNDLKEHPFFKGINFKDLINILPPNESSIQQMISESPLKLRRVISHNKLTFFSNDTLNLDDKDNSTNDIKINNENENLKDQEIKDLDKPIKKRNSKIERRTSKAIRKLSEETLVLECNFFIKYK